MRDLASLPKAHLHVHLEGAMRPSTLSTLAAQYSIEVPPTRGYGSFAAFAGMYIAACGVLQCEADVRRLFDEVVEDAAQAGAVWVEPAFYLPRYADSLGSVEAVLEVALDALEESSARHGIGAGLIVAADRTVDPDEAVELAELAVRYASQGVVAFGLANDEALFGPKPFAEAFAIATDGGLLSTPHAGELDGPASVASALDDLGAHRIQHGVRAIEDVDLVARLAASAVCLDVCPTSNVMLSVVPSLDEHPLGALLDAGVRCSVNADDPLLFGPGLLEEYELCRSELGFDDARLALIAHCSVEASGAPEALKAKSRDDIAAWLTAPSR
ncbi:MAG: adenosine deaminase [Acidimicrobiaceae bacterium]|jgi:adenosine deaminase